MEIPYYEVLAFTNRLFAGNPAGICFLEREWLPEDLMQKIAAENNLAETAFLIERADHFDLRWMTPEVEVDLCGHATLGSAHVLFCHRGYKREKVVFETRSGQLGVSRRGDQFVMDFPAQPATKTDPPETLAKGLGAQPEAVLKGRDYLAVFATEADVAGLQPNFEIVRQLGGQGVIATAPGDACDFVSRYFVPAAGIPEDPVTGSTHCALIPYWSKRLGKRELRARQISPRGGELFCRDRGERVEIAGEAITYLEGKISLP
jgi:PhzF family phenazine biosynthesis protein